MRKRIFEIIEKGKEDDKGSRAYDFFMITVIAASMIPMMMKASCAVFTVIDKLSAAIFAADYAARMAYGGLQTGEGKNQLFFDLSVYADGIN